MCYDQAIALNPKDARPWSSKGIAFFNQGNYDAAIVCYDQAITLDPKDVYS